MKVQLKKVAGGYELFIPDELAASVGIDVGQPIEVAVLAEKIIVWNPKFVEAAREALYASITPETLPTANRPSLEELLAKVTDDNIHGEVDWGPRVGREVW